MATVSASQTNPATATQNINGAEVLVRALIRQGVDLIFAYPGGCSMPMHQSLTYHRDELRTILPRHEQGGGFAAQGVARTTNEVGVVMATSGPGATNLVTAIADAKMDSVPLVAITGQVPTTVIGTDAFQETPIVEICRAVTKHHYLVTDAKDIPRIIKEAFYIAKTGRPGPVLVDVPKNVQLTILPEEPDYDPPMDLPGYHPEIRRPHPNQIRQILAAIRAAKKPVFYIGGGIVQSDSAAEFTKFAKKVNIPVAMTVMGLGGFPGDDPQSLHMLGMHGTVYSNYAIAECDLLLAFGVRFDDRVTGKLDEFVKNAKIVHVDIDPSEVNKNKRVDIGVVANIKEVLQGLNALVSDDDIPQIDAWWNQVNQWKTKFPLAVKESGDFIIPQYAISELNRQTRDRETYVAVGVGQHQMFAAQYYKFNEPKHWLSSSGLGTMGFGLPAAMGVQARHPDALVIDIDGDGSVLMNIQELATLKCEKLPIKIFLLNNQHLGMVVQWEDRFHDGNRAHTYLGPVDHPEATGDGAGGHYEETYPNFVEVARGFGLQAAQVRSKKEFPAALAKMLASTEPYLLDIVCPYQEHVLPMIPSGRTVRDIIIE
ncbi:MAG TPA: biosynthetic-type acetolactate synthase large subunit [Planctomycetaceae bacterium]|nr:biosynthetic-type acetolactate synthase large subunit [Planctomycetaceae bacterium]